MLFNYQVASGTFLKGLQATQVIGARCLVVNVQFPITGEVARRVWVLARMLVQVEI